MSAVKKKSGVTEQLGRQLTQALAAAFATADVDGNAELDWEEFRSVLPGIGLDTTKIRKEMEEQASAKESQERRRKPRQRRP